jgi:hypothetical protein
MSREVSVAVLPVLRQNTMFALCSTTVNYHNDLHGIKSSTRLRMNDKREETDLVQGEESAYADKLKNVPKFF